MASARLGCSHMPPVISDNYLRSLCVIWGWGGWVGEGRIGGYGRYRMHTTHHQACVNRRFQQVQITTRITVMLLQAFVPYCASIFRRIDHETGVEDWGRRLG